LDDHVMAMTAAGATDDATLRDSDFDGATLTAPGRAKLAMMLRGIPADQPASVYVSVSGTEERNQPKLAAVDKAVKELLPGSQVQVKLGSNPTLGAPANRGLNALIRLEKEQEQSSGRSAAGSMTGTTGGTRQP
jgi:hypothetical protein